VENYFTSPPFGIKQSFVSLNDAFSVSYIWFEIAHLYAKRLGQETTKELFAVFKSSYRFAVCLTNQTHPGALHILHKDTIISELFDITLSF